MGLRRTLSWCLFAPLYVCSFQSLIPAGLAQESKPATASTTPPPPNTLLDGTPVKLRLSQTISSADAKVGQEFLRSFRRCSGEWCGRAAEGIVGDCYGDGSRA